MGAGEGGSESAMAVQERTPTTKTSVLRANAHQGASTLETALKSQSVKIIPPHLHQPAFVLGRVRTDTTGASVKQPWRLCRGPKAWLPTYRVILDLPTLKPGMALSLKETNSRLVSLSSSVLEVPGQQFIVTAGDPCAPSGFVSSA